MRKRIEHYEEDPTGLSSAARDFNSHQGPARIFYNRNSGTFYTYCYPMGSDRWFGPMSDGLDLTELYRKTSATPDITVTAEELRMMESEIVPYSVW